MKFPTQYNKHERVYSEPGSKFEPSYTLMVMKDGTKDLVVTGKINTYEKIQSFKEDTDLKIMIEKYLHGDTTALNRKVGMQFVDVTKMPTNMAEVYQMTIDSENYFNSLPLEVRKEFGFDFGRFMNCSNAELVSIFNKFKPSQEAPIGEPDAVVVEQKIEEKGAVE